MHTSRRAFIGSAAAIALLLERTAPATAQGRDSALPVLPAGSGQGRKVLILGAGIAGLVAAYELQRAGCQVRVLEARQRVGGRCWTLRRGDRFTEMGGGEQLCAFPAGQYLNPGANRILPWQRGVLSYAQQFGLPLELFASGPLGENWVLRNAPGHRLSGQKVRYRDLYHDEIGYAAERLAGLLQERGNLSPEDAALLAWARKFGLLDGDAHYRGAAARGWAATPGVTSAGVPETPFAAEDVWSYGPLGDAAGWTNSAVYPTPVLTITGGIDGLAHGFARRLPADVIQLGAEVVSLRQDEKGVAVRWRDAASGAVAEEVADQAVCTIPFTILSHVDADFDPAVQRIIANLAYMPVVKAGLAFRRRFWEEDDRIFGGYSYIDDPNMALIYPSAGLGSAAGVLTNYYLGARDCLRMGGLAPDERRRRALADVERIHPEAAADFESAVTVVWSRMPWSAGCAGAWTPDSRARDLPRVAAGDRRVVFAGEHVSHIPAWMEGAVVSAHAGLRLLRDKWKDAP